MPLQGGRSRPRHTKIVVGKIMVAPISAHVYANYPRADSSLIFKIEGLFDLDSSKPILK